MNETIYFQESEDFTSHSFFVGESVLVQTGMLRVGRDTHSLAGVNSTKIRINVEQSNRNQKKIKPWRYGLYLYVVLAIIGAGFNHYFWPLILLYAAMAALYEHQLDKAKTLDEIQRRCIATLVLKRSEGETSIVIGEWTNYIDDQLAWKMMRAGYSNTDASRLNEHYTKERDRAYAIANAVASAIVHGTDVTSFFRAG